MWVSESKRESQEGAVCLLSCIGMEGSGAWCLHLGLQVLWCLLMVPRIVHASDVSLAICCLEMGSPWIFLRVGRRCLSCI